MSLFSPLRACAVAAIVALLGVTQGAADPAALLTEKAIATAQSHKIANSKADWYDASNFLIEGRAFEDSVTSYSRLAPRHKPHVTGGVWSAGQNSTGVSIRFVTDSPQVYAGWESPKAAMVHMAWTGSGGMDLYARQDGEWKFAGVGKPTSTTSSLAECVRFPGEKKPVEYMMVLPSYSLIKKVEIGVDPGCRIASAEDRYKNQLPIVFYGTSITQGGCASRSGMGHVEILRRQLDYPTLNLGFSGSGKCEMPMADLLAEIPASIYVIETLQNMTVEQVKERMIPFTKALRAKRPETPIIFMESPNIKTQAPKHLELRKAFDQLQAEGFKNLHYLAGDKMYNTVEEPTVDGTHPTDLGFYQMAMEYELFLRNVMIEAGVKPGRE